MLALPTPQIRPIFLAMIADELVERGRLVEASVPIGLPARRCRRHRASVGGFLSYSALRRDWRAVPAMSGPPRGCCRNRWRWADEVGAIGWSLRTALSLAHLQRNAGREREAAAVLCARRGAKSPRAPALRILTTQRNCCCSYGHKSEGCASWVILLLASIDCNCITASGGGHRQYRRQVRSLRQNAPRAVGVSGRLSHARATRSQL